mmetsp:Transcript_21115/g.38195  ORF Transcript_21115/g.38195 Transcript_21115/m.38195 type:complete len:257 (-) Transcript_21115:232-1002(-)
MPGKKRKADTKMWGSTSPSSSSSRRKGGSSSRRGGGGSSSAAYGGASASGINESKAEKLFAELCEEDNPGAANMEGICKLCEQLDIDPFKDIRVLVLLWKLGANKKPAEIQKEEWMAACHKFQLDSIDKFKKLLPGLDTGFLDREEFGDFYKFCFQFNRAGTHKTLDKELIVDLLKMCVTGGRITSHRLETFCEFLETTKDEGYSKITLDQWRSFLDFSYEYPDPKALEGYDEGMSAWPVLIDEYVEFMEMSGKKK